MERSTKRLIHTFAGTLALVLPVAFLTATLIAELGGDRAVILGVKRGIAWGLLLMVPCMALVGTTGFRLAGRSGARLVELKRRRMRWIAANGLLVLMPAALVLFGLARAGSFGAPFVLVQGIELLAGTVNVVLIGLNIRDGLHLSGRGRRWRAARGEA